MTRNAAEPDKLCATRNKNAGFHEQKSVAWMNKNLWLQ